MGKTSEDEIEDEDEGGGEDDSEDEDEDEGEGERRAGQRARYFVTSYVIACVTRLIASRFTRLLRG